MISHRLMRILVCKQCGSPELYRRPRTLGERLSFRTMYKCKACGTRTGVHYWELWNWFSLTANCPKCGNPDLKKLRKIDRIEPISWFLISRIQQILGAPLLYCQFCRLQFYDYRPKARKPAKPTAA